MVNVFAGPLQGRLKVCLHSPWRPCLGPRAEPKKEGAAMPLPPALLEETLPTTAKSGGHQSGNGRQLSGSRRRPQHGPVSDDNLVEGRINLIDTGQAGVGLHLRSGDQPLGRVTEACAPPRLRWG